MNSPLRSLRLNRCCWQMAESSCHGACDWSWYSDLQQTSWCREAQGMCTFVTVLARHGYDRRYCSCRCYKLRQPLPPEMLLPLLMSIHGRKQTLTTSPTSGTTIYLWRTIFWSILWCLTNSIFYSVARQTLFLTSIGSLLTTCHCFTNTRQFAKNWNFEIITYNPGFLHSNIQAERSVYTVEMIMKIAEKSKSDSHIALLNVLCNSSVRLRQELC